MIEERRRIVKSIRRRTRTPRGVATVTGLGVGEVIAHLAVLKQHGLVHHVKQEWSSATNGTGTS